jgi:hypothetical protein
MPRIMQARVPQGSVLYPTLFNMYINDTPKIIGVYIALFPDDTCLYAIECKEGHVLRKLQHGLNSSGPRAGTFKMTKTRHRRSTSLIELDRLSLFIRPPESLLTSNGRNISFVNNVKYLRVIFDKKIAWRSSIKMTEAKAFRAFIRTYSLFKNERLSTNFKATLHK